MSIRNGRRTKTPTASPSLAAHLHPSPRRNHKASWIAILLCAGWLGWAPPRVQATLAAFEITQQPPAHEHRFWGMDYSTSVAFSSPDSGATTVQWQKDGVDIPGATSTTLTLNAVTFDDGGYYRALITYDDQTLASTTLRFAVDTSFFSFPYVDGFASDTLANPLNPSTTAAVPVIDEAASHERAAIRLRTPAKRFGAFASITVNPVNLEATAQQASRVALGDFNGDTWPDLVVGGYISQAGANGILVYLNNRPNDMEADPFDSVTPISLASGPSQAVAVGDLDGDGWPDIAVAHNGVNKVWFHSGLPATPFMDVTPTDISTDADNTMALLLIDINGDHAPDLISGNNGVNRLYLNNGSSMPFMGVQGMPISADAADTRSLAAGDIDGDGDLDLIVGNSGATDRIHLHNGTRNPFEGVAGIDLDAARTGGTRAVVVKDLNSDGLLDILVGHADIDNLLYLNSGMPAAPFSDVTPQSFTGDNPTVDIQAVDIDVDGDLDLLVTTLPATGDGKHKVYLNNHRQDTPFANTKPTLINPLGIRPSHVVLGDLDRDGDPDMVVGDAASGPRFYDNAAGTNPFIGTSGFAITGDTQNATTIAVGDIDRDGHPDVLVGISGANDKIYFGDSTPTEIDGVPSFSSITIASSSSAPSFLLLKDLNGDLYPDLAVIRSGVLKLYMNDTANARTAPFSSAATLPSLGISSITSVTFHNVNGDNSPDMTVGSSNGSDPIKYVFNNGGSDPFNGQTVKTVSNDSHVTRAVFSTELNFDGSPDIVAANNGINRVYLNNNGFNNPFQEDLNNQVFGGQVGFDLGTAADDTRSLAVGIINSSDILPDIVIGNDGVNRLYLQKSGFDQGFFYDAVEFGNSGDTTLALALADANGDGTSDIFALEENGGSVKLNVYIVKNTNQDPPAVQIDGPIQVATDATDASATGLALGDLDLDGDPDIVTSNSGTSENRFYPNLRNITGFTSVAGEDLSATTDTFTCVASRPFFSTDTGPFLIDRFYWLNSFLVSPDIEPRAYEDFVVGRDGVNLLYRREALGTYAETPIGTDAHDTRAALLTSTKFNEYFDLIAINSGSPSRIYYNLYADQAGGEDRATVYDQGVNLSDDVWDARAGVAWWFTPDGYQEIVIGVYGDANKVFLNNTDGTFTLANDVNGSAASKTLALATADFNGDGQYDLVEANDRQANKVYLGGSDNNHANPFNMATAKSVGGGATTVSTSVAVGDVNGDGYPDIVFGARDKENKLFLNNGTDDPFNGVSGMNIGTETDSTEAIRLHDVDGDGDLDVFVGNNGQPNRLYLNNGGALPFSGVSPINVTDDAHSTIGVVFEDLDSDKIIEMVAINSGQPNRLYRQHRFQTHPAEAFSQPQIANFDMGTGMQIPFFSIFLGAEADLPAGTRAAYYVSTEDSGMTFRQVRPGHSVVFDDPNPTVLTWRMVLESDSPFNTPSVSQLSLELRPEIEVIGDNFIGIADGDTTPEAADGTDFGTANQGDTPPQRTYTLRNVGSTSLTFSDTKAMVPDGFTAVDDLPAMLESGESATITVQLDTDAIGTPGGQVVINNDDADEGIFNFNIQGTVINTAPTLATISDPAAILEDAGQQTVDLSGIAAGGGAAQTLMVTAVSSNPGLIPHPTVNYGSPSTSGSLSYTPVADANGMAIVTVTVMDDAGTANGGVDVFQRQFTVNVTAENDAPSFTAANPPTVLEDAGMQTVNGWVTQFNPGPADEGGQGVMQYTVANISNPGLFTTPPAVAQNGALTYTPAANLGGTSTFTVSVQDTGGTGTPGAQDTSPTQMFTITVTAVNDAPTFGVLANPINVAEDSGTFTVQNWTIFNPGPSETDTVVQYNISSVTNPGLFAAQPLVSNSGTLSFTPGANQSGSSMFTVTVQDSGGTANGGSNVSAPLVVTINVSAVNDPPAFIASDPPASLEDAGQQTVNGWATFLSPGPNEGTQALLRYNVSNVTTPGLFSTQPAVDTSGNLTYTAAADAFGTSMFTVTAQDNGGTLNNGDDDTSAEQTFTITVTGVNDRPNFSVGPLPSIDEDAGPQTHENWATFDAGKPNESSQAVVNYIVSNIGNPSLFATAPAINPAGTLTYTTAPDAHGSSTFQVRVQDNGGTDNAGIDVSLNKLFTLTANPVEDPPTLNPLSDLTLGKGAGLQTVNLTGISSGAANESQTLMVMASSDNPGLIPHPDISYISPTTSGTLSFTPVAGQTGSATLTVTVDDGAGSIVREFDVSLNGPVIQVEGNGQVIASGDISPSESDHTGFGSVNAGETAVTRTFTVRNLGNQNLIIDDLSIPSGFTLTEPLDSPLAPAASDTFSVTLPTDTPDNYSGTVSIANSDAATNPYAFAIAGTVGTQPPMITSHPAGTAVALAGDVTLTVIATGTPPLTYQWKRGTTTVGTDSASLTITDAQAADADNYTVVVSNSEDSVTSNPASLQVGAEIHGNVFSDPDQDGMPQDPNVGVETWTVYADLNENGEFDEETEPSSSTDSQGDFTLVHLAAGDYLIRQQHQPGWKQTFPESLGGHSLTADGTEIVTDRNFGLFQFPFGTPRVFVRGIFAFDNTHSVGLGTMASITTEYPSGSIFYTLDGSTPTISSTRFTGDFSLDSPGNPVLRAVAFDSSGQNPVEADPVAIEVLQSFELTAMTAGGGTVALSPPGGTYTSGTSVTVTATPDSGFSFIQWQGDSTSTETSIDVVMDSDQSLEAVFGAPVATSVFGNGSIDIDPPSGPYPFGSSVRLTALPDTGQYLAAWLGDAAGIVSPVDLTILRANHSVTAGFSPLGSGDVALTIRITGKGTVNRNPISAFYPENSTVILTPVPAEGWVFDGWSGDASGSDDPLDLALNTSKDVTATFIVNTPPSIALTSPADDAEFTVPASVAVQTAASDADGSVSQVQFFEDGNPLGTDTSAPFNFFWVDPPVGTHVLTAVATDNHGATATSEPVTIVVSAVPPTITLQPVDQNVLAGDSVMFTAAATGTAPLGFQWQHNLEDIPGATSSTLTVAPATTADAGSYRARVSNPSGTDAFSEAAALTVVDLGLIRKDTWVTDGPVNTVAQSGGILYLGGDFDHVAPVAGGSTRLDPATGAPDPGFPRVNGEVKTIVPDGAGGWYLGGFFSNAGGLSRNNLAHVLADGSVNPDFAPVVSAAVNALALSSDGSTLYVGGTFFNISGLIRNRIAALSTADGDVLPWNPDANGSVDALAVSGDAVFAGGQFTQIGGASRKFLAKLDRTSDSNNALPWAADASAAVTALLIDSGTVYVGGLFQVISTGTRNRLAALDEGDATLLPWNPNASSAVRALALADGRIYVGGDFQFLGSGNTPRAFIAAVDSGTGALQNWNPTADNPVWALAPSPDGNTIYAGGDFNEIDGQIRNRIAALDAGASSPGNYATAFDANADKSVRALAAVGGSVIAGGQFGFIGRIPRSNLAAIDLATGVATDWNPGANNPVQALAVHEDTVYIGGSFSQLGGQSRNNLGSVSTAGALDTFAPNPNDFVNALAVTGDGTVFVGGEFTQLSGQTRNRLGAFTSNGSLSAFDPGVTGGPVQALQLFANLLYVGGDFTQVAGESRNRIAVLDIVDGLLEWNPDITGGAVQALAVDNDTVYAGGLFDTVGGFTRNHLAAIDAAGSPTTWNPDANGPVNALAVSQNTVYAGGAFSQINGLGRNGIAALRPKVTSDYNKNLDPNADAEVRALDTSSGTLFAGGAFTSLGGSAVAHVAAIGPDGPPVFVGEVQDLTLGLGTDYLLDVPIYGFSPLLFSWFFNNNMIAQYYNNQLLIENLMESDAGTYAVEASNTKGSLPRTTVATVGIASAPMLTTQPQAVSTTPGNTVVLTAAATGSEPIHFQWRRNGVNIPGANSTSYTIDNAQPEDSGSYNVAISNPFGAENSVEVQVVVSSNPVTFPDNFSDRVAIPGTSGHMSGGNSSATRESQEPRHADKPGDTSVWFAWTAPNDGIATFSTRGSGIDTLLGVYVNDPPSNVSVPTLVQVVADNDEGGFFTSEVVLNAEAGTEYKIAVAGFANAQGNLMVNWLFEQSADEVPQITDQPDSVTVTEENTETVTLTASAVNRSGDTTGLTYQWFYHADPIEGATSPTLMIPAARARDVGSYRLQISRGDRRVRTVPAVLEIGPNAEGRTQDKFDDLFAEETGGQIQTLGGRKIRTMNIGAPVSPGVLGTQILGNIGSTKELFEPNHGGFTGGASRWFTLQADSNGTLLIDTLGSEIDTVMAVYTGDNLFNLTPIASDADSASDGSSAFVSIRAVKDTIYSIAVDSEDGEASGLINLNWRMGEAPVVTAQPTSTSVRRLNDISFSVEAVGDPTPMYQWRKDGVDIDGATGATLNLLDTPLSAAGNYTVVVQNLVGVAVSQVATLDVENVVHFDLMKNQPIHLPDGNFQFRLIAPEGQTTVIEASSDLENWTPIFTIDGDMDGVIEFTDEQASELEGRFYRTRPPE